MLHHAYVVIYIPYIYSTCVCGESRSPWTIFGSCFVRRLSNADIPSGVERARSAGGQLLSVRFLTPIDLPNQSLFWVCFPSHWHMETSRASKESLGTSPMCIFLWTTAFTGLYTPTGLIHHQTYQVQNETYNSCFIFLRKWWVPYERFSRIA